MAMDILPKISGGRSDAWRDVTTALGLSTAAAVALGLSRFAYGLLLPPMQPRPWDRTGTPAAMASNRTRGCASLR